MFQHMKHLQRPPEGTGRIDDPESRVIAPVLENMKVYFTFFPVEQQVYRGFKLAKTLHRELPASRVGGHENQPAFLPDPFQQLFPPAVADRQLTGTEHSEGGAIHQHLADFNGDPKAVPKAQKCVSPGETPRQVWQGPIPDGRSEENVVQRDERRHDVGGAPACETD